MLPKRDCSGPLITFGPRPTRRRTTHARGVVRSAGGARSSLARADRWRTKSAVRSAAQVKLRMAARDDCRGNNEVNDIRDTPTSESRAVLCGAVGFRSAGLRRRIDRVDELSGCQPFRGDRVAPRRGRLEQLVNRMIHPAPVLFRLDAPREFRPHSDLHFGAHIFPPGVLAGLPSPRPIMSSTRSLLAALALVAVIAPRSATAQGFTLDEIMTAPVRERPRGRAPWQLSRLDRESARRAQRVGRERSGVARTPDHEVHGRRRPGDREPRRSRPTVDRSSTCAAADRIAPASGQTRRSFPAASSRRSGSCRSTAGAPRKIADGSSPRVSPSGDSIAFVRAGQIWIGGARPGAAPSQLTKLRGGSSRLRWSPDGKRLAFVSDRSDHSFVGVYDFASQLAALPGPERGPRRRAGVVARRQRDRVPAHAVDRVGSDLRPERESAIPWSIRVADAATGTRREIWRAEEGHGQRLPRGRRRGQLFWARAATASCSRGSADGWTHLYPCRATGGAPLLLTPGEFEVEHVSADARRPRRSSTPRTRTTSTGATSGACRGRRAAKPVALTSGDGIEWSPVVDERRAAIVLPARPTRASPHAPAIARRRARSANRAARLLPADFPAAALVVPEAGDLHRRRRHADPRAALPAARREAGRAPPGGDLLPRRLAAADAARLALHVLLHNAYAMNQYLASHGYVVLSVNYRSGIGYGLEFREALNYGAAGRQRVSTTSSGAGPVPASARRRRPGAHRPVGRLVRRLPHRARAVARLRSVRRRRGFPRRPRLERTGSATSCPTYDPLRATEIARLAFESSPMADVDDLALAGAADPRRRRPQRAVQRDDHAGRGAAQARRRRRAARLPDEVHDFLRHANWMRAYKAAAEFFNNRRLEQK